MGLTAEKCIIENTITEARLQKRLLQPCFDIPGSGSGQLPKTVSGVSPNESLLKTDCAVTLLPLAQEV